jgi:tetratricopeptide (TPR) repeat protein
MMGCKPDPEVRSNPFVSSEGRRLGTGVNTKEASAAAGKRIGELLDQRQTSEAIAFAEACEGPQQITDQLRAVAYTHAGEMTRDRSLLEHAVALWHRAGAAKNNHMAYNLANAELALWQLLVRERGYVAALEGDRGHLSEARALFRTAGQDESVPEQIRVQALTNLGNSYDSEGRDIEAIVAYDEVLALKPSFGMALGNKGTALKYVAPFAGKHRPTVLAEAVTALDAALEDEAGVVEIGGAGAWEHFRERRAEIKVMPGFVHQRHEHPEWHDPHLRWCAEHELFLHVSLSCLSEAYEELDALYFSGITVGLDDVEQRRANDLIDAFNTLKQDYIAARYLLWLTDGTDSPIREHAAAITVRAGYLDTLRYARWGPRTGLATQAFAAASNLLDKIAGAVHIYYRTARKSHGVYFRYLWHPRHADHKPDVMDPELVDAAPTRGLRALCDLSCELERRTALNELLERRHAATHRFLVVHRLPGTGSEPAGDWLEHVDWDDLVSGAITLLRTARSALIYLARMIDIEEHRRRRQREEAASASGKPAITPPLPLPRSMPEHPEYE